MARHLILIVLAFSWIAQADEAELLAAIRMHPDEDTPRLIYADYLEEHGQIKQAAFIRAHIELHRSGLSERELYTLKDKVRGARDRAMEELLGESGSSDLQARGVNLVHERGLIEEISLNPRALRDPDVVKVLNKIPFALRVRVHMGSAGTVYNRHPMPDAKEFMELVKGVPLFDQLSGLEIEDPDLLDPNRLKEFLNRPKALRELRLKGTTAWNASLLGAVAQSRSASTLRVLDLEVESTSSMGSLVDTSLPALETLRLSVRDLNLGHFKELPNWPLLHALEIKVWNGAENRAGTEAFVKGPAFAKLRILGLNLPDVSDKEGIEHLIERHPHQLVDFTSGSGGDSVRSPLLRGQIEKNKAGLAANHCYKFMETWNESVRSEAVRIDLD